MATWDDVRTDRGVAARDLRADSAGDQAHWRVKDKLFAWERPLRRADLRGPR